MKVKSSSVENSLRFLDGQYFKILRKLPIQISYDPDKRPFDLRLPSLTLPTDLYLCDIIKDLSLQNTQVSDLSDRVLNGLKRHNIDCERLAEPASKRTKFVSKITDVD